MTVSTEFEILTKNEIRLMSQMRRDDIFRYAVFLHRALADDFEGKCYSDRERKAFLLVTDDGKNALFAGDWTDLDIPLELLPPEFFTSACPPVAFEKLEKIHEIKESWPCWRYFRAEGFGNGPWDDLDRLNPDDSTTVDKYWNLHEDAEEYLRSVFEKYESACIRIDGKPVAWAGLHFEIDETGEMGFTHTLEEHRGKGYATLVTKSLVNRIVARGKPALCFMFKTNDASISLVKKLDFVLNGEATWADIGPRL